MTVAGHILCASDLSGTVASSAVSFARTMARQTHARITLVPTEPAGLELAPARSSAPSGSIVDLARVHEADLIVVSTDDGGAPGLGRTASEVVRTADCDVLVVPEGMGAPAMAEVRHILAPTDFSVMAQFSVRYAAQVARELGATLTVLHVVESVAASDDPFDPLARLSVPQRAELARRQLADLARELDVPEVRTCVRTAESPAGEIAQWAIENQCDLVVMGTHGQSGPSPVLLGRVVEGTVRTSRTPVLVHHAV